MVAGAPPPATLEEERCGSRAARPSVRSAGASPSRSRPTTSGGEEYGGLKIDQAKRLKDLERENERLKKAASELTLDKQILKEALSRKY
jgi:putative transposase